MICFSASGPCTTNHPYCVPIEFGTNFVHHLTQFSKPPSLNVPLVVMVLLILLQLCQIILTLFYGYRRRRRRPRVRFPTNDIPLSPIHRFPPPPPPSIAIRATTHKDQHHTDERKNEQFKKREEPKGAEDGRRDLPNSSVLREKPRTFPFNNKAAMDGLPNNKRNKDKPLYALASIPEEEETKKNGREKREG